ncbi:MAG TPA: heparan-alpha-glucosaminide N-acetyltransferase domain-containing protein, partial [Mucilaginibacter sp.]|nr:heparan-alpha-glucosaminide N-acetyltransferase domain-containing protein [Mucilaginibacter sp.]
MVALAEPAPKQRIASIDILRGLVMLIMAIDHIRDFFHYGHPEPTDLAITTPILFFTRWITHFCAPTFVFLSGISAYLAGTRRTKSQFSAFLIKRGLWLIAIEVIVITFAITLDPLYHVLVLQVIWAIGGSMVLLGLLVWLPMPVIAAIGIILVFGHNILDPFKIHLVNDTFVGKLLLSGAGFGAFYPISATRGLLIAYALLPWTGLMMIGYVLGTMYTKTYDAVKRRKLLLYYGLGALVLFFILRYFNIYGDP